ncbi:hypothetical protein ECHM605_12501 [Escherichia coli HM605]|nr:hypothetical protein ECHM605_12501 [Escherichia coli HM605]
MVWEKRQKRMWGQGRIRYLIWVASRFLFQVLDIKNYHLVLFFSGAQSAHQALHRMW